jgi:SnoaL-like domain
MPIELPPAISLYISASNRNAPQDVKKCFTDDAVVRDESKTVHGTDELQQWMTDTKAKYQHTIEPLYLRQEGEAIIVTCRLTGDFPGSPIEIPFKFALSGSKIASLQIA